MNNKFDEKEVFAEELKIITEASILIEKYKDEKLIKELKSYESIMMGYKMGYFLHKNLKGFKRF